MLAVNAPVPAPLPALAWPLLGVAPAGDQSREPIQPGDEVVLGGGDALLDPNLPERIAAMRSAGAESVAAWTDGRALCGRGVAEALKRAGLREVGVVLFGADAAGHDFVASVPGHFERALRGLRAARRSGLRTTVVAPVLRPTFRDLPLLFQRAMAIGVQRFEIVGLTGPDRARHGLLPHMAIAAPHLVAAIELVQAHRRRARAWLIPPCLLGSQASAAVDNVALAPDIGSHFGTQRIDACATCALQPTCSGPTRSYISQHGDGGFRPL